MRLRVPSHSLKEGSDVWNAVCDAEEDFEGESSFNSNSPATFNIETAFLASETHETSKSSVFVSVLKCSDKHDPIIIEIEI